ncbi:hypothetical protein D3C78_1290140 [compost metagenome]
MSEQPTVDRIEEAFGNLKTWVLRQQIGIHRLHPTGEVCIKILLPGDALQLLYHQADVMIIQVDSFFHRLLYCRPVRPLKTLLRTGGHLQEAAVLCIKALQDRLRDQQLQFCRHPYLPPEKRACISRLRVNYRQRDCIRTAVLP